MKKIFLLIILLITSCGYQPIYLNSDNQNFKFSRVSIQGNDEINKKIINLMSFKEDEADQSLYELALNTSYDIKETAKNSKGQVESYRSKISVNLKILSKNNTVKERNFFKEFSYNTKKNKYDLIQYQKQIQNNLIEEIVRDINIFLNLR
tara:strand:- start:1128 stop:1577 length:450 start_codon:yes stop_codon:yes gene_type:complete